MDEEEYEDYEFVESFIDSEPDMNEDEKEEFMEDFYSRVLDTVDDE